MKDPVQSTCCEETPAIYVEADESSASEWRHQSSKEVLRFCPMCGQRLSAGLTTSDVVALVVGERRRQDTLWGRQDHVDGTGFGHYLELGIALDSMGRSRQDEIPMCWADILIEEVGEALSEMDPEKLKTDLIQVAAVAVSWVESISRAGE